MGKYARKREKDKQKENRIETNAGESREGKNLLEKERDVKKENKKHKNEEE